MTAAELGSGDGWSEPDGAVGRVYLGVMRELESRQMVPGQRLVETELAAKYGVGRNAVREAIQRLAMRGVADLSRNRSASIRSLDGTETLEVLDVASAMIALVAQAAARRYDPAHHSALLLTVKADLEAIGPMTEPQVFSRARRQFYRALLTMGGNRELQRVFPAIGMHIIYSQFQSPQLQSVRLRDYLAIMDAVVSGDAQTAAAAAIRHVENVRLAVLGVSVRPA